MNTVLLRSGIVLVALASGIELCSACADDVEMVKEKLFQAKRAFDAEVQKFKQAVHESLDKREDEARTVGNKKAVDQIKSERNGFESNGELPTMLPSAIQQRVNAARASLQKAYDTAVKDYLKLKADDAADSTDKEAKEFILSTALLLGKRTYLATLKHSDLKVENKWFSTNGKMAGTTHVFKWNGEPAPHSIYMVPSSKNAAQVSYTTAGKYSAFRASVGIPIIDDRNDTPASALMFEVLGDGKSLWKSKPTNKRDTSESCVISIEKVKVLTLRVHCPEANAHAHAVWFEPILVE